MTKNMWLMAFILCSLVVSAHAAVPALASKIISNQCTSQENVNVTVSFNFKAKSFAEAKTMFDAQQAKVAEYAKQQGVKLEVQSQNYNISSQALGYRADGMPDSYTFQANGSIAYKMDNADMAFKFAESLSKQNMQVGLNSNSYRSGNCTSVTGTQE